MNLSIGIIGLPTVGKSTLFNALLKRQAALVANYPFATIEPNIGIVDVPDDRLNGLVTVVQNEFGRKAGEYEVPRKIIPATVKFYDIAGLVKGAHKGEGLGNEFLGHIREVSALVHVVRDFADDNIIRSGSVTPAEDIGVIETELILADMAVLGKLLQTAKSDAKTKDPVQLLRYATLEKLKAGIDKGIPARDIALDDKELKVLTGVNLLTQKPIITVYNVAERDVVANQDTNLEAVYICAKLEADIAMLTDAERADFLAAWGMGESGLDRLIRKGFSVLGLQTFFTAGPKEVHSWTINRGCLAPEAAGAIHSDFERGFIGADVIGYSDLIKAGSYKKAKDLGLIRLEGKMYLMRDGDVVEFRFNV